MNKRISEDDSHSNGIAIELTLVDSRRKNQNRNGEAKETITRAGVANLSYLLGRDTGKSLERVTMIYTDAIVIRDSKKKAKACDEGEKARRNPNSCQENGARRGTVLSTKSAAMCEMSARK